MFETLLRLLSLDVSSLASRLRVLFASKVAYGTLVTTTLRSGTTSAAATHGLGRPALGFAVVSASAAGAFTPDPVTTADTVTVRASVAVGADVAITLWVF